MGEELLSASCSPAPSSASEGDRERQGGAAHAEAYFIGEAHRATQTACEQQDAQSQTDIQLDVNIPLVVLAMTDHSGIGSCNSFPSGIHVGTSGFGMANPERDGDTVSFGEFVPESAYGVMEGDASDKNIALIGASDAGGDTVSFGEFVPEGAYGATEGNTSDKNIALVGTSGIGVMEGDASGINIALIGASGIGAVEGDASDRNIALVGAGGVGTGTRSAKIASETRPAPKEKQEGEDAVSPPLLGPQPWQDAPIALPSPPRPLPLPSPSGYAAVKVVMGRGRGAGASEHGAPIRGGIHVGTTGVGKMKGDASDINIALGRECDILSDRLVAVNAAIGHMIKSSDGGANIQTCIAVEGIVAADIPGHSGPTGNPSDKLIVETGHVIESSAEGATMSTCNSVGGIAASSIPDFSEIAGNPSHKLEAISAEIGHVIDSSAEGATMNNYNAVEGIAAADFPAYWKATGTPSDGPVAINAVIGHVIESSAEDATMNTYADNVASHMSFDAGVGIHLSTMAAGKMQDDTASERNSDAAVGIHVGTMTAGKMQDDTASEPNSDAAVGSHVGTKSGRMQDDIASEPNSDAAVGIHVGTGTSGMMEDLIASDRRSDGAVHVGITSFDTASRRRPPPPPPPPALLSDDDEVTDPFPREILTRPGRILLPTGDSFALRGLLLGPKGAYMRAVQTHARAVVAIKSCRRGIMVEVSPVEATTLVADLIEDILDSYG